MWLGSCTHFFLGDTLAIPTSRKQERQAPGVECEYSRLPGEYISIASNLLIAGVVIDRHYR